MQHKYLILTLSFITALQAWSGETVRLSLDTCHSLALNNNKELQIAATKRRAAAYDRKSAFTAYLPKVSATAAYMHTGKELSLLSDEQKTTLSHIGDALSMPALNAAGQSVVDALHTDTRNAGGIGLMLTQPLYLGGKIRAYNNITRYAEGIADDNYRLVYQQLIADVDETYWNIVALSSRKKLADAYLTLVSKLDSDIEKMIAEGFATKADGLSVKVKVNEAKVAIIQVDNGINILKMRMCQLCDMPLDTKISLEDENTEPALFAEDTDYDTNAGWQERPELSTVEKTVRISEENVRVVRAGFLPSAALNISYMASNPSVFNSFERRLKGTWSIGVAVNIPLVTWGERIFKVRAAQAKALTARLQYEHLNESIGLQVSQYRQKVTEAREKYSASLSSQAEADENLRYAGLGLSEGVIPVSNVLEAQTAWLAAKTNLINAGIEMRLADIHLRKALGIIKQ